jgi:S1-C subfamily serine protease
VFSIGNPAGFERTIAEGVVSGVRHMGSFGLLIQHTAPISPGSSGGALFDSTGSLLGLTVAFVRDAQNLNFAISATSVEPLSIKRSIVRMANST